MQNRGYYGVPQQHYRDAEQQNKSYHEQRKNNAGKFSSVTVLHSRKV